MTREQLQALIDRVIGKKGILRAPSYWVRRLFNTILEYVEDLINPKSETYTLPEAGEYAVDSETGKKLLEIINNPDKYILQRRVSDTTGETFIRYYAGTMNTISDSHIYLTTPARITHTYHTDRVAALEFTHSIGMIGKAENAISVGFSDIPEKASFGIGVDSKMSDVSEYTVSNKVIKAYVDDAVSKVGTEVVDNLESESTTAALSANQGRVLAERIGDIDSILDSINGEEI